MVAMTVNLPRLHPAQWTVAQCQRRFIVLVAGRRYGKTMLGTVLATQRALNGGRVWWVAPTYKMANVGWRGFKFMASQIPGARVREADRQVLMPGGGWVEIRSADDPQSLRGEGLDYVVLDECSRMAAEAWTHSLRPALSERRGGALFITSPAGRDWVWQLYMRGQTDESGEWASFRFPTGDNPLVDPAEIEAARQLLPERIFRQEYLAEFLEDSGAVFRQVRARATAPQPGIPSDHAGHRLVLGVDWGKWEDFTALSLVCADCGCQVDIDRFNRTDYTYQLGRLDALVKRWGGPRAVWVVPETNAMGEPLVERLVSEMGYRVQPFTTLAHTKPPLIESLALALEKSELALLPDPVQLGELEAYTMELVRATGRARYSAPAGAHDDTVMALALAWWGVQHGFGKPVKAHTNNPFYT